MKLITDTPLSNFHASGRAKDLLDKIGPENVKLLDEYIDAMHPYGVREDQLNQWLSDNPEDVYDILGIEMPLQEIQIITNA